MRRVIGWITPSSLIESASSCNASSLKSRRGWLGLAKILSISISPIDDEPEVRTASVEIEADAILMAKNVDAIYSADPNKDPNAVRYTQLTYREALDKNLKATDITAMALAMDNNMTMVCFGLDEENSIVRVVRGEAIGTTVKNEF